MTLTTPNIRTLIPISPLPSRAAPRAAPRTAQLRRGLLPRVAGAAVVLAMVLAGCAGPKPVLNSDDPRALEEANRLTREAEAATDGGDFKKAEGLYKEALNLRPDLGSAWNNLGFVFRKQGNGLAAADAFRRAADLLPGDPRPSENLGHIYLGNGLDEDALRHYRDAVQRDENSLAALRGITVAVKNLSRSDEYYRGLMRRAVMVETDPKWKQLMERQRIRIEADLKDRIKMETGG